MVSIIGIIGAVIIGTAAVGPLNSSCERLSPDRVPNNLLLVQNAAEDVFSKGSIPYYLAVVQAIHESNLLNKPSQLAWKYNNLFGITQLQGTKGIIRMKTREHGRKGWYTTNRNFSYNLCLQDSFKQYKTRILENPRYKNVKTAKSFEEAAWDMQKAGYATDPAYAKKLISIYHRYIIRK